MIINYFLRAKCTVTQKPRGYLRRQAICDGGSINFDVVVSCARGVDWVFFKGCASLALRCVLVDCHYLVGRPFFSHYFLVKSQQIFRINHLP